MRVALIGCGAIGTGLLELIQQDAALSVAAIVVTPACGSDVRQVAARLVPAANVCQAVPQAGIDIVIEVAGHAAIRQHVVPALSRGVPAIIASVGALSAGGLADHIEEAARRGRTQARLIAGAIGGIDALAAARIGGLDTVRYTGRKPPLAWAGTPAAEKYDLVALKNAALIFEGSAREAAMLYPKNANVAATVAMAGLGLDCTGVRLFADPTVSDNVHEIEADGTFGSLTLSMRNRPLPTNPKTSALTVYSAAHALRARVACLSI